MTIDDLFSGAAETARGPQPPPPRTLRVVSLIAWALVLTALAFVGLRIARLAVPLSVLFAAAVALVLVWRLALRTKPPLAPRQAGRRHDERTVVPDGAKLAVSRWDTMMDWSHTDAARFNRKVLPRIAEVVDERLRQRHGITREGDPARARALLGDPLWTFLTTPARRPPHPRDLDQIVTALEKL